MLQLSQCFASGAARFVLVCLGPGLGLAGCAKTPKAPGQSVAISIAPLSLEGVTDATYDIAVTNLSGDLVWQRELTSGQYGNGAGDLTYVGPCDASPDENPNTVTLTLTALAGTDGEPLPADSWQNPGPVALSAECRENADTPVVFNLGILRSADQGFFDIGVNFADIFCSAKLDCVDALLHDPATNERGPTANIAFACTAGAGQDTTLYWGEAAIVCRDGANIRARYPIDPTLGRGQHGPIAATPTQSPPGVFESAIYSGTEDFADLDKCYWNMALGLDATALGPDCTFEATATAADAPFTAPPFSTPSDAVYPIIRWSVPLTGPANTLNTLVCGAHALNANDGRVTTEYAPQTGFPLNYQAGCGELATTTPTVPDVTVTVSVVDEDGVALPGLTLVPTSGDDLPLPGTLTTASGSALTGQIPACDGTLTLPASAIARPDVTLTVTLPGGQTTSASTPGTSAIIFVIPQYRPVAWWQFEVNSTATTLSRDSVAGWACESGPAASRQIDGVVGKAVDLVGFGLSGAGQLQCYTRLTAAGQPYNNDMRLAQRPWLSASSITVEAMFENTRLLEAGVNGRLFHLNTGSGNQLPRIALHYHEDFFRVYTTVGGVRATHNFNLDGVGIRSAAHYHSGWHHVAVTYDRPTGQLRLWLDGVNPDGFVKYLGPNTALTSTYNVFLGGGVFTPFDGSLDEVALYDQALPAGLIHQHARDALDLQHTYGTCERSQVLPPTALHNPDLGGYDPRHLAPGYPSYDAQGTNPDARTPLAQLQHFQAPRYADGHTLPPQSSWMGGAYLAGQLTGVTGATLIQAELDLMEELATFWHYTVKVTDNVPRQPITAGKSAIANGHSEWKTFAIGLWPQISTSGTAAAYDAADLAYLASKGMALMTKAFISGSTSELSLDHFPNDGTTRLDARQSPVSPLQTWTLDGKAIAHKLQPMLNALAPRIAAGANAIDHYNENGEVLSTHGIPMATLQNDPLIVDDLEAWDPTAVNRTTTPPTLNSTKVALYLGHAESRINNAYLAPMRAKPEMANTVFTYYAIDGNRQFRARYEEVRKTMTQVDGSYRATPDFYPRVPQWANHGQSAWHGFNWIANARRYEIAAGDKLYWPFLAAGWDEDPKVNILPGQWLGLLKLAAVLGADTWYPAFFSLEEPFPQPEGWVWQAAMPAYAHAITSRYEDVLRQGDLVVARTSWIAQSTNNYYDDFYSLYTKAPNSEIVVARRLGDVWVFAGTIQPKSNIAGTQALYRTTTVYVDWTGDGIKEVITLPIRRQGSVYRWDRTTTPPTLVQLDRWHEAWHPWWWSRDFLFDAEVHDGLVPGSNKAWTIYTDAPNAPDYSDFTTSLRVEPADTTTWTPTATGGSALLSTAPAARYAFQPRAAGDVYAWVRARVRDDATAIAYLSVADGTPAEQSAQIEVTGDTWAWYRADADALDAKFLALPASEHLAPSGAAHETTRQVLTVRPGYAQLEIDQVLITTSATRDPNTEPPESTFTEVGDLP